MTSDERIAAMTKAILQAIKVMGDRFGSTEQDVARAIQALKDTLPPPAKPAVTAAAPAASTASS